MPERSVLRPGLDCGCSYIATSKTQVPEAQLAPRVTIAKWQYSASAPQCELSFKCTEKVMSAAAQKGAARTQQMDDVLTLTRKSLIHKAEYVCKCGFSCHQWGPIHTGIHLSNPILTVKEIFWLLITKCLIAAPWQSSWMPWHSCWALPVADRSFWLCNPNLFKSMQTFNSTLSILMRWRKLPFVEIKHLIYLARVKLSVRPW